MAGMISDGCMRNPSAPPSGPLARHYPSWQCQWDLVQNLDYAQTFLDICGAKQPMDMQGRSLLPLLKGETPEDWRKSIYYQYYEFPGSS